MAIAFSGKTFTFTQPDGTKLEVRGWGDQNHAVFETLDGFTLTQNPVTGYWEKAALTPDGQALQPAAGAAVPRGVRVRREAAVAAARESALLMSGRRCEQRREERRQQLRTIRAVAAAGGPLLAPPQRQTVGTFVGLCLLIDFSDAPQTIPRDEVDRFCNQAGYTGFGNNGSVSDFFRENSIGKVTYTNLVAPYYRAQRPKSYYTDESIPQPQRAYELINEALQHHLANGFDFSPLTVDNQGYVYALNVYYAGHVQNNWAKGLWPHAFHLAGPVTLSPGKKAYDYQFTAMESELTLGTFCHENGHMLCDFPDLYDYGYESSGVGAYCLMCGGNNISEKNPIPVSAYLKRMAGWANIVTPLEHNKTVTLTAGSNDFAIFSKGGREYFILENRRKSGRDSALPDEGLAIWHVDEDGDNSFEQMTGANHYELSLMQADGQFHLERQRGQNGDSGDLYAGPGARFADDSSPHSKWWNGTSSNLTIDQITAAGTSISFRSLLGPIIAPPQTISKVSAPARAIPDNNPAGITDAIPVAEALTLATIKVGVDITHPFRGDLRVVLTTPWGAAVELHPKGRGGGADNLKATFTETDLPALATLRGRSTQGAWTLTVQDHAASDTGRLNRWTLDITAAPAVTGPIELKESPGAIIPDNTPAGIERTLTATGAGKVGAVEVSVDIAHTWVGDLRVALVSPAGTEVLLHDGAGGSADNLVRDYTVGTLSSLGALAGQSAAGPWKLRVADRSAQDTGKLNAWRVLIKPTV